MKIRIHFCLCHYYATSTYFRTLIVQDKFIVMRICSCHRKVILHFCVRVHSQAFPSDVYISEGKKISWYAENRPAWRHNIDLQKEKTTAKNTKVTFLLCMAKRQRNVNPQETGFRNRFFHRPAPGTFFRSRRGARSGTATTGLTTDTGIESKLRESSRAWWRKEIQEMSTRRWSFHIPWW